MQAEVKKWGNSLGVRLPKLILEQVNVKENDKIEIEVVSGEIVIKKKDILNCNSLEELFENFDGEYERVEIDWGKPVGREVW
jgi:antitoxin MazE